MTPEETSTFANTCVNFNGFESVVCLAGVKYEDVKQKGFLSLMATEPRYPCCDAQCTSGCPKKVLPSTDQIQHKARLSDGAEKARKRITAALQGLRGISGKAECPVCGRLMKYQSRPYSSALKFKCETDGCLDVDDMR